MILTFIFIGFTVIGITLLIVNNIAYEKWNKSKVWKALYYADFLELWGLILAILGGICIFFALMCIIGEHVGVDNTIRQDNIRYESLCKRLEIVNSDYEDVSKSEVINNIAEWNIYVTDNQYWAKNPWTNWFHSQKRVDNLKLIEY